jgi:F0F1-type ATP synthase assembly protein I
MAIPPQKDRYAGLRSAGLLLAIPTLLIVSPLLGAYLGNLLDRRLGSSHWFAGLGLILGFAAAGVETMNIIRRSQEEEKNARR